MTTPFTVFSGSTSALTNALLAPNSGISVSNIILNSSGSNAVNFYDGSLLPLGIGAGLLLTSGTTPGTSNTTSGFGQNNNGLGDPDIDTVVNTVFQTKSYDATTLAFDFTVSNPNATSVTFDLIMGSEEYPEYVNSFVDSAIVLINGVNYALFGHNALNPLSVISQNVTAGYFQDNTKNVLPIEYDGVSQMLKIVVPIKSGTNHIKIGIADTGDSVLDSGVFIANLLAGSTPGSGVVTSSNLGTLNNDTITGSAKDEYLDSLAGDDIIYANGGDDIVVAGAGNDTVYGGSGNDQIQGDTGNDSIDGGEGIDTAVYPGASTNYIFSYNSGVATLSSNSDGIDTLQNVENFKFKDGIFKISSNGKLVLDGPPIPVVISGTETDTSSKIITKVLMGKDDVFVAASNVAILGNTGYETVKIQDGVNVIVNSSVERIEFAHASSEYTYKTTSTGMQVLYNNSVVANVVGGQKLSFTDGSASILLGAFDPVKLTVPITLGGAIISSIASSIAPTLNKAAGEISTMTSTSTTGIPVLIAGGSISASAADVFKLAAATSSYTTTITNGFNYLVDKIQVPVGSTLPSAIASGVNNVSDGNVDLTWFDHSNLVTISLTGLNAATEAAMQLNAVSTVFGTY